MEEAIVSAVIWFFLIWLAPAFVAIFVLIGAKIFDEGGSPVWALGGLIAGWISGLAWLIFAVSQVALSIINAVQLA